MKRGEREEMEMEQERCSVGSIVGNRRRLFMVKVGVAQMRSSPPVTLEALMFPVSFTKAWRGKARLAPTTDLDGSASKLPLTCGHHNI